MRFPRALPASVRVILVLLSAGAPVIWAAEAAGAPTVSVATAVSTRSGAAPGGAVDLRVGLAARGGRVKARVAVRLVQGRRTIRPADTRTVRLTGRRAVRITLSLPKKLRPGRYRVVVCATPSTPVSCRQAKRSLEILSFRAKGRPLTVSRTLDTARAVTSTIGPEGGALTVTSGDGSRAVLTLPKGAVRFPTPITMTPVTSLSGHPARPELLVGVSLRPDSLALQVPGRLELTPARNPRAVFRAVLTGDGEGGMTLPEPYRRVGGGARIDLLHFSSYELAFVAKNNLRGQEAILDWTKYPPPKTDFAALRAELARRLGVERQRQLLGIAESIEGSDPADLAPAALQAYYDEVVKPLLEQAGDNCEVAPLATGTALAWARQAQLTGLSETDLIGEHAQFASLLETVMEKAPDCLARRCIVQGYPEAVPDFLSSISQAQKLGIPTPDYYDVIRRCLRFTVVLDSEIGVRFEDDSGFLGGPQRGGFKYVVHGEAVTPPFDLQTNRFDPVVLPLAYTAVSGEVVRTVNITDPRAPFFGCSGDLNRTAVRGTGAEVRLRFEAFHINPSTISPRPRRPQDELTFAELVLESGDPFEWNAGPFETYLATSGVVCPYPTDPTPEEEVDNLWAKVFAAAHSGDRVDPAGSAHVRLNGFSRGTNPVFLKKQYVRDGVYGGLPYYEITTVTLVHSPIKDGGGPPG